MARTKNTRGPIAESANRYGNRTKKKNDKFIFHVDCLIKFAELQAEILSESISLGDLCHTKASLRLPLKPFAAGLSTLPNAAAPSTDGDIDDLIVQSPSVQTVQSLDSLCTSSGNSSDKLALFATFGSSKSTDLSTNSSNISDTNNMFAGEWNTIDDLHDSQVTVSDSKQPSRDVLDADGDEAVIDSVDAPVQTRAKVNGKHLNEIRKSTRQSDSTDEDSGIESIMRVTKEVA